MGEIIGFMPTRTPFAIYDRPTGVFGAFLALTFSASKTRRCVDFGGRYITRKESSH